MPNLVTLSGAAVHLGHLLTQHACDPESFGTTVPACEDLSPAKSVTAQRSPGKNFQLLSSQKHKSRRVEEEEEYPVGC
ncbi:hypothetical protein NDU88_003885 [Pleurodeles waltl]|uniref:Uncharacterized protein n=1 Tax=Pleurodeles waltl TaxID=8319 RepID=A0AAV7VIN9_PLEWA|nr:hypothetical protein NDU88_003885 [Pleurodeles waltl]